MRLWPARKEPADVQRSALSWAEFQSYFTFLGNRYPYGGALTQTVTREPQEQIGAEFQALVQQAYKQNGPIFALILTRMMIFSDVRFQFRRLRSGKPGDLFSTSALAKLERPWPNGTTSDLLARMESDASLAGNWFGLNRGLKVRRMRPDWVTIVIGTQNDVESDEIRTDIDAEVIGYAYTPGGPASGRDPQVYLVEEVAHYAPIPDPEASFRGMSWLVPVIEEVMSDKAATNRKLRTFESGTPNVAVEFDKEVVRDVPTFDKWVEAISGQLSNIAAQHRALFLGAGTKAHPIGLSLEQMEFKVTQGAGETRMAQAAGVPPIVAGFAEGLEAATYSNYGQARRHFADGTLRYLWRSASGALATIVDVPADAELWYDTSDTAFLQEDRKDAAEIQEVEARTIRTLADSGFKPDSVVQAVQNADWSHLTHTGLPSVQVQQPPNQNGKAEMPGEMPGELAETGG